MNIQTTRGAPSFQQTVIFDNGRTVMRHLRNANRQSDRLVVTFAEMMMNDPSKPGFAQDFLIKNGYDVVTVQKRSETWYQDLSVDYFRRVILRISGEYSGICCYGISMGAFASLYFGGSIDASIIAISPLCSIHPLYPSLGAPEYRAAVLAEQVDLAEAPKGNGAVLIIYDPLERNDRLYVREEVKPAFPNANYVIAPGTGHPSSACLSEMGILRPMTLGFIAGNMGNARKEIRAARYASHTYMVRMAQNCHRNKHSETGEILAERARHILSGSSKI